MKSVSRTVLAPLVIALNSSIANDMSPFDDAQLLVAHATRKFDELRALHSKCLTEQVVSPEFRIEVKNFMENLRSILDYCARGLFTKYGRSPRPKPNIYFPYVIPPNGDTEFREIIDGRIPGLALTRPDIVDLLASYQWFGNTGNWLYLLMRITNENKHEQLSPQIAKEYKVIEITCKIPAGGKMTIDLTNIPLANGTEQPIAATVTPWSGLEFSGTNVIVVSHLEYALLHVSRMVSELSAA